MEAKAHLTLLETPEPVFGLTPDARPGQVPWNAAAALLALLIAVAGVAVLVVVVGLLAPASTKGTGGATESAALSTLISTVIVDGWFIAAAWWFSLRRFVLPLSGWGFRRAKGSALWLVPVALVLAYIAGVAYTSLYSRLLGPPPEQTILQDFPRTGAGIVLFATTAILVAPLFEEMFFRGFLFQGLARSWGPVTGAAVSAGVFALAHQQLSVFVPLFALGLLLAWVFYRSGSLWANIALHASFNGISVLVWAVFGILPPFHLLIL
jgi:membrane protease YdiL (CAAX protease family)